MAREVCSFAPLSVAKRSGAFHPDIPAGLRARVSRPFGGLSIVDGTNGQLRNSKIQQKRTPTVEVFLPSVRMKGKIKSCSKVNQVL